MHEGTETTPRDTLRRRLRRTALAAALLLLGGAQSSPAATLASGVLWSEDAVQIVCFVVNVSAQAVKIESARIVNSSGGNATGYNGCVGTLLPGKRCGMNAEITQGAGIVVVDAPKGRVRGTCQLNAYGSVGLLTTEMR